MLLQVKSKRGLSIVISYVLLIAISIVMSIIVYAWLKTYVPTESLKCSEGTSFFIKDVSCANSELSITVINNGRFSINGYFIHVSNKSGEELPTIDLSNKIIAGGNFTGNSVIFSLFDYNFLSPDAPRLCSFNISAYGPLYKVELIPIRIEEIDKKNRSVSCTDAKVESAISCT